MKLFGEIFGPLFKYPNTQKKTKYQIQNTIWYWDIQIPNTNTTIWSNYLNSIRIPIYSSHPVSGQNSNRGLSQRLWSSWETGGHIALDIKSDIFLRLLSYPAVSTSVCCVLMIVSLKQSQISSSKVWEFPASIYHNNCSKLWYYHWSSLKPIFQK